EGGHNWRSIIFSLLVIGFVIAGIVTAIYLLGNFNYSFHLVPSNVESFRQSRCETKNFSYIE
ncbi:hypothetical protein WN51_14655, partial [Melipona quadrifasciata]